jgi:ceramide glucosyltransferase
VELEYLIPGLMLIELFLFLGVILVGSRHWHRQEAEVPVGWPKVAMIVPVTGASGHLVSCLRSLVSQDYPDLETVFVVRDPGDGAAPIVRDLLQSCPGAKCVFSGPARTCAQKNHNLLAGIGATGDEVEVLVFADGGHEAPAHWLRAMVGPIARREAVVTTGYHHVTAQDWRPATLCHAIAVLLLYLFQGIPGLTQPWGGATAMAKPLFERLGVRELWSRQVVDDVALAAHLRRHGVAVRPVPAACFTTPMASGTFATCSDWLMRQWLYLKFYFPATWLAGGIMHSLLAALVLLSGIRCV